LVSPIRAQGIVISGGWSGHARGYGIGYGFGPYSSSYGRSRLIVVYSSSQTTAVPVVVSSPSSAGPNDLPAEPAPRRVPEQRNLPPDLPPPAPLAAPAVPGQNTGVFRPLDPDSRERARRPVEPERELPPPPPEVPTPPLPAGASLVDRGRAAFTAGEYGRAADYFRRAAAGNADDPQPPFHLVQTLIALGKYTAAADTARAALERFPRWPALTMRPGDLYGSNIADYRNHLRLLGETQASHADDAVLLFLYGHALWFDGQKDEARALFRRAAASYPAAERFLKTSPPAVL
jgi:hypothetical protein